MHLKKKNHLALYQTCIFSQFCLAPDSLINVIYTLQHQALDFLNTSKLEQLFDREKLMMSCPEPSAGSPTPRAPSLNNRMSTTAGPVFGEGTCQSSSQPAGDQVHRPIRGGPCTAGSGPGSGTPSGREAARGQQKQRADVDTTRAFGTMLPFPPSLLLAAVVRWRSSQM